MKAKMVAGILALSMISNGILSKEPTKLIANDLPNLKQKADSQHRTTYHKTYSLTVAY
ncbi:hypothetical protein P3472_23420 [Vibrio parahaemolyticus]|uniref:hypothetical protein n=1 Tax=Vibrio parahaemolyticus TaxID=670 RepID=UPI001A19C945|nr:hypothetical protein [Vibrio parahaemolyticus]MDF4514076.1 hypothetical protein [Vibrio parahaemolyticus]HAS6778918.1 hypothetical protein [Vibrio parahaemolyticus]HAS6991265.1 hypothetical protein [Vibrio parahaemolyticus]